MESVKIITNPPKVFVIGWTNFDVAGVSHYLRHEDKHWNWVAGNGSHYEGLLEVAGRVCYASLDNPRGKTTDTYLQESIVQHKHESVIEHATINFLIADLPRSVLMELSRHRVGVALSFESTRFTFDNMRVVMPPLIREQSARRAVLQFRWQLEELGYSPDLKRKKRKRIVEAARGHLPNEQGCDGVWTANLRALRHIMLLRSHPDADLSFREFVCQLWEPTIELFPSVFADMQKTTDEEGYEQIVRRQS
jgi:thymidylate synthase (FAD)